MLSVEKYYDAVLYDLDADPEKQKNLVAEVNYEEIKHKLRILITDWIKRTSFIEVGIEDACRTSQEENI